MNKHDFYKALFKVLGVLFVTAAAAVAAKTIGGVLKGLMTGGDLAERLAELLGTGFKVIALGGIGAFLIGWAGNLATFFAPPEDSVTGKSNISEDSAQLEELKDKASAQKKKHPRGPGIVSLDTSDDDDY